MFGSAQPYLLLAAWITLGISVGFVAAHTIFGAARGLRAAWPVALLFAISGWAISGTPGLLIGVGLATLVGMFVTWAK